MKERRKEREKEKQTWIGREHGKTRKRQAQIGGEHTANASTDSSTPSKTKVNNLVTTRLMSAPGHRTSDVSTRHGIVSNDSTGHSIAHAYNDTLREYRAHAASVPNMALRNA
eukprot:124423-Rhodomonas_salina.2